MCSKRQCSSFTAWINLRQSPHCTLCFCFLAWRLFQELVCVRFQPEPNMARKIWTQEPVNSAFHDRTQLSRYSVVSQCQRSTNDALHQKIWMHQLYLVMNACNNYTTGDQRHLWHVLIAQFQFLCQRGDLKRISRAPIALGPAPVRPITNHPSRCQNGCNAFQSQRVRGLFPSEWLRID